MERAYLLLRHQVAEPAPWGGKRVHWLDESSELPCRWVCDEDECWGYVGVPPGHPFYGLGLDECPMDCREEGMEGCEHSPRALLRSPPVQQAGSSNGYWWFGFPCTLDWEASREMIHALARQLGAA